MANESFITYKEPEMTVSADNKLWFYTSKYFDRSYANSLWFANRSYQWTWFEQNYILTLSSPFSYAIKDEYSVDFRVPYGTESLLSSAYICRVKNKGLTGERRWYYFIDSIDAYSPNMSIIHCTLDVIQTFMFDWKLGNQHILKSTGAIAESSALSDPRNFTNEDFMPEIEECSKTQYIDPLVKDTPINVTHRAFTYRVYLVVCTEMYNYDLDSSSVKWWKYSDSSLSSSGINDPSELLYCVFTTKSNAQKFLSKYDSGNKKNAIKGVYGIPWICAFGGTRLDGTTDSTSNVYTIHDEDGDHPVLGYLRSTGARYTTTTIDVPSTFYNTTTPSYAGFTPKMAKSRMIHCLSLETRNGKNALLKMTDVDWVTVGGVPKIQLTIIGVLSISPKVLVFPHIAPEVLTSASDVQTVQLEIIKNSNYLSYDISPSFSVYDDAGEEIYNKNYETAMNTQTASMIASGVAAIVGVATTVATGGATAPLLALGAITGGTVGLGKSAESIANLKATYQKPQNMIGSCESSDLWFTKMGYLVARWLSPVEQNLRSFDEHLMTEGYNYAGKIEDLGHAFANGHGITKFGRKLFVFIQTQNCKIVDGNIGIYREKIESIFNNGIRFWDVRKSDIVTYGICNYNSTILNGNQNVDTDEYST